MRCRIALVMVVVGGLCSVVPPASGQQTAEPQKPRGYTLVIPLKTIDVGNAAIQTAATGGGTIPLWKYSITASKDSNLYTGMMVGRSPFFHGARTTTISTVLVPVRFIITNGSQSDAPSPATATTTFDPTVADTACLSAPNDVPVTLIQQSPMLSAIPSPGFTMNGVSQGETIYNDAFQRANFWSLVSPTGNSYHTLLSVTTTSAYTITVPPASGAVIRTGYFSGQKCPEAVVDETWLDPFIQTTVIPAIAQISPNTFPIFLFYDVVQGSGSTNIFSGSCCILGYHSAYTSGGSIQTYSPLDFDTSGIFSTTNTAIMAHEIGEWLDDPTGTNPTPPWGFIGQTSNFCQNNLEVGDPLTRGFGSATNPFSVTMSNNFTYSLQELAFFSWFFNSTSTASLGTGGKFSDNGSFSGPSQACPPGGTN